MGTLKMPKDGELKNIGTAIVLKIKGMNKGIGFGSLSIEGMSRKDLNSAGPAVDVDADDIEEGEESYF